MILHATLLVAVLFAAPVQDRPADCATIQDCRRLALEAADHQDFEAFHDLAWRAFRKGPKDPELMRLLARAQSLSGRPLDALVMLDRLLALGITTDAASSEDFRRVRALPGWADFDKRVSDASSAQPLPPDRTAAPAIANPSAPARAATADPAPAATGRGRGRARGGSAAAPAAVAAAPVAAAPIASPPSPPADPPAATPAVPDDAPLVGDAGEALRFTTIPFTPAGLAYDRVSNRFIVGDHDARKLTVVDEASQRVANLAGAQSAGFGSIAAFEIDAREGDLWVVSSPVAAPPDAATAPTATLHKLQLISGRVLYAVPIDRDAGTARFTDVAVTPQSAILVLDAAGRRVFVAPVKTRRLDLALQLTVAAPTSLAPESESVVYVAHADGILRADLSARRARPLTAARSITLAGIARLRWHRGALLAVQASADGSYRIVRLKLDGSGQRVTGLDVLDRSLRMPDPTAMSISSDVLYYLAAPISTDSSPAAQTIVRRVTVK